MSDLPPLDVPGLLRRFGLRPKKRLGQNFLIDEAALRRVAQAAELGPNDTVLEIGPGLGSLTRHLAARARRVVAVELDGELLPVLEQVLGPQSGVELVLGDILTFAPASLGLPAGYRAVANIPYYITSAVIRHLLESEPRAGRIVLTVQREVAERLCAGPGEMSLLAVSAQFYGQLHIAARLPAGAFYPRPEVDSAVVRLEVSPSPRVPVADVGRFFRVVRAGFSQKRKQLRNALAGGLAVKPAQAEAWLVAAGLNPARRAETLTLEEWGALAVAVDAGGSYRQG